MSKPYFLCGTTIIKNEVEYLDEWIAYHLHQGIQHFFLYDNGSTDGSQALLRRYINHGLVTLIDWPKLGGQVDAYNHSVMMHRAVSEWMAFFDVDEFFYVENDRRLCDLLQDVDPDTTVVRFPWRNYGFSGHLDRVPGLVIERFDVAEDVAVIGSEINGKLIARQDAVRMMYVHQLSMKHGQVIDSAGRPLDPVAPKIKEPDYSVGRLNHYYTKSVQEFREKIERGQSDGGAEKRHYGLTQQKGYNTPLPASPAVIAATRETLQKLTDLSPEPAVFGRFMPQGYPVHDVTDWHFRLSLSNYTHRAPGLSNQFEPLPVGAKSRHNSLYVVGLPEDWRSAMFDDQHMRDFLRRNRCALAAAHPIGTASGRLQLECPAQRRLLLLAVWEMPEPALAADTAAGEGATAEVPATQTPTGDGAVADAAAGQASAVPPQAVVAPDDRVAEAPVPKMPELKLSAAGRSFEFAGVADAPGRLVAGYVRLVNDYAPLRLIDLEWSSSEPLLLLHYFVLVQD